MRMATNASGYPLCQIKSTTWQTAVVSSKQIAVGAWAHIVCTYDLVNLQIYVNGELTGTQALTALADDTSALVKIGIDDSASTPYGILAGLVDEFKFFNFALSEDEVKQEYNSGSAFVMGAAQSANNNGTIVSGASTEYCVPGDTAECSPPVLELKMDELSGGTVYDTSGNGNNGTLNYMSTSSKGGWTNGKIGSALQFDGADDFVQVTTNDHKTNNFTAEAWIYHDTYTQSGDAVFGCASWSTIFTSGYVLRYWGSNTTLAATIGSASDDTTIGMTVPLNTWTHVVMNYDGTTLRLYMNGILANSGVGTYTAPTNNFRVGRDYVNTNTVYYHGKIDDVRVYDYARTPAQIAWDYNRGKPIAEYRFDECGGSVIHDESGNGNHGTLSLGASGVTATGTCASSSNSFWYNGRAGKNNAGGSFDNANNDQISITDSVSLSPTNQISVSFWTKSNSAMASDRLIIAKTASNQRSWKVIYEYFEQRIKASISDAIGDDGTIYGYAPDNSVVLNDWQHTTVVYDSAGNGNSGKLKIYLDGVLQNLGFVGTIPSDLNDTTSSVVIGGGLYGQIDDVKIFNYVLTAEQVKNEYNGGAAVRF
jgi:hypothetical protein